MPGESRTAFERLVAGFGKLPGIGRRSAERMALRLIRGPDGLIDDLIDSLQSVRDGLCCCEKCGSVTLRERNPCRLCTSSSRDSGALCVVEEPGDIVLLERSGEFHGRYHSLMGKLSPMRGEGPRDLRVDVLLNRVRDEGIREVILALSTDVEGDATASFLAELLTGVNVKVSRLAFGLPARSGIAYSDPVTLGRALKGRTPMD